METAWSRTRQEAEFPGRRRVLAGYAGRTKNSTPSVAKAGVNSAAFTPTAIDMFEYSGISDVAAVTVRQTEVNPYLVRELPDRMANA